MTKPDKATRQRIALLQRARQAWLNPNPNHLHFDYCITCSHTTSDPACEGCCAKQFRADRVAGIEGDIREITGNPQAYRPTKRKPHSTAEQLPLFA